MEKLYYLQNIEQWCVWNALVWRKYDNNWYTCKLKEAKQFTEKEALELCEWRWKFRAYPVEYIQANEWVYEIVDWQYLDKKEALKHV
jgi:hypothetical protein